MITGPYRCGQIAIVGRPNVGKSTLLNALVGEKISIVSSKPQTTRHRITGIRTNSNAQFIFVDTPGFQTRHRNALNQAMNRRVTTALDSVDVLVWVVEALRYTAEDEAIRPLLPVDRPVLAVINKVDRLADKNLLLPYLQELSKKVQLAALVPISATKNEKLEVLLDAIRTLLPENPPYYADDELTDRSVRFLVAELMREKVFRLMGDELPYAAAVEVERFTEENALTRIAMAIWVDRPNHKAMLIGSGGQKLKRIASEARLDIERLLGHKVFLEVWVRVKSGWADNQRLLHSLGYE